MREVAVDLADDRFDVRYDPARVDERALLAAVRELGYSPEVATRTGGIEAVSARVDPAQLPAELRELFARSRAEHRPILLDFFAPG